MIVKNSVAQPPKPKTAMAKKLSKKLATSPPVQVAAKKTTPKKKVVKDTKKDTSKSPTHSSVKKKKFFTPEPKEEKSGLVDDPAPVSASALKTKKVKNILQYDLIKTIADDEEVPDLSEPSDDETEYQPTKKKQKNSKVFDSGFEFVGSVSEYNHDHWNDVSKYIKRKAKRKTDDKIDAIKKAKKSETEGNEVDGEVSGEDEYELSDEDMKRDDIKSKDVKRTKKHRKDMVFKEEVGAKGDVTTFYTMNLSRPLLKAIAAMNFVTPTPIQASAVPVALLGRDICGCAATGTGKTAAYMLPILERLLYRPVGEVAVTRVLVLVPTRELGVQVYQVAKQLAQFTTVDIALSVGGLDLKVQEASLRKFPDVVIATPGRLIDHVKNSPGFSLESIEVLVLDEADRMLDEYFAEQMKEIVRQCARTRQTLLFSATMTTAVEDLARVSLTNPVKIFVDSNQNVAFNLRQEFVRIRKEREEDREAILSALLCRTFRSHCIVFVKTKRQAHRLHILLGLLGLKVGELHGDMRQPQRLDALARFRDGLVDILVATDVAARGLDIVGVRTVVNYFLPTTLEHYIHRVGRTARAGRSGVSVSLAGENERKLMKEILVNAKNTVKSRIIPQTVLERYITKVAALQKDIDAVLKEEEVERQIEKTEKALNRTENLIGSGPEKREWFQTQKQRNEEKDRLDNAKTKMAAKAPKVKPKKAPEVDKQALAMERLAQMQSRLAKRKNKLRKLRSMEDDMPINKSGNRLMKKGKVKHKKSSFEDDLTNVSRKKVKGLRYETNKKQKMDKKAKKSGKPGGKPPTGKQGKQKPNKFKGKGK